MLCFLVPACFHRQDLCFAFWVMIDGSLGDSEPQVSPVSAMREEMRSSGKRTAAMCYFTPTLPSVPGNPARGTPRIIDKEIET